MSGKVGLISYCFIQIYSLLLGCLPKSWCTVFSGPEGELVILNLQSNIEQLVGFLLSQPNGNFWIAITASTKKTRKREKAEGIGFSISIRSIRNVWKIYCRKEYKVLYHQINLGDITLFCGLLLLNFKRKTTSSTALNALTYYLLRQGQWISWIQLWGVWRVAGCLFFVSVSSVKTFRPAMPPSLFYPASI